ncbi:MAG: GGDEF domain-containing protein [Epsilonproteobacteria bacterium]|nr:GGDEF domain-containing protein [Campylobacterota bacterium]
MKAYLKYLLIFFSIGVVVYFFEVYIIMDPIPLKGYYFILPILFLMLLAYFPARLEHKLKEQEKEFAKRERMSKRFLSPVEETSNRSKLKYDKLTGAITKDSFNEIIGLKMIEAKHINAALSLIIFDIDHFKKINDTYGHLVGDAVLKELSELVRSNLRKSEYFVRWGGEEFVILLPGTSLKGAQMVAEKLRRVIEAHEFPTVKKVTCSFGVTTLKSDDTIKSFMQRADEALYQSKNNGRNQVTVKV